MEVKRDKMAMHKKEMGVWSAKRTTIHLLVYTFMPSWVVRVAGEYLQHLWKYSERCGTPWTDHQFYLNICKYYIQILHTIASEINGGFSDLSI